MDASFSLRLFVTDSEVTYYYGWEKRSPQPEAKDRTWQSKFSLDLANLALWIVSKAVLYFSKKNLIRFTQSKLIHFKLEKSEISTNFFKKYNPSIIALFELHINLEMVVNEVLAHWCVAVNFTSRKSGLDLSFFPRICL